MDSVIIVNSTISGDHPNRSSLFCQALRRVTLAALWPEVISATTRENRGRESTDNGIVAVSNAIAPGRLNTELNLEELTGRPLTDSRGIPDSSGELDVRMDLLVQHQLVRPTSLQDATYVSKK